MGRRTLCLWFDFISPYAYFAWKEAPAFCEAHGLELDAKPVLFAALLNHWGQLGPAEIAPKRIYTFKHCVRRAARRELPFGLPPAHPFNPLLPLRIAALEQSADQRHRIVDAFFDATWGGGFGGVTGIDEPEKVRAVLVGLDLDADTLIARATTPEHKAHFLALNQAAIDRGVFGVPTLAVDEELFWGSDVFEDVAARIAGRDPIDAEGWQGRTEPKLGAQRRR